MKFKFTFKIFLLTIVYGFTLELSLVSVYALFTSRSLNVNNNISTGFWITPSLTPAETPTPTVTGTPTPTPTASPLLAYWKMEEGTGSSVADSSGNGHILTLGGGPSSPSWDSTNFPPTTHSGNKSLLLDGIDDFASTPSTSDLNLATGFTIEVWIKADTIQFTPDQGIVSKWTGGNGYMMWLNDSGVVNFINGSGSPASGTNLRDNFWHHIAIVWDGSQRTVYIDGAQKVNQSFSTAPNAIGLDLILGNYIDAAGARNFKGNIDEVRIYNSARSQSEIIADSGILP